MRYLAIILALLPFLALGGADPINTIRRFTESQPLTRTAPTADCDLGDVSPEGMQLDSARSIRVMLEAPSGQTLTGGNLRAYYYDWSRLAWFRNPANDLAVTSGVAKQVWEDLRVLIPTGCVLYATDSVTLSGAGTAAQVSMAACYASTCNSNR